MILKLTEIVFFPKPIYQFYLLILVLALVENHNDLLPACLPYYSLMKKKKFFLILHTGKMESSVVSIHT